MRARGSRSIRTFTLTQRPRDVTGRCRLALGLLALLPPRVVHAQFPRVRDSAGVHIVENSARASASIAFHVGEKPILDLGGLKPSPDDEFTSGAGYLKSLALSDGRQVVIDQTRVRFFDARGKQLRVVGRNGEGPREFRQIASACRSRGDTLVISDPSNGRVTIMTSTGAFVRQLRVELAELPWDGGCLDDGSWLVRETVGDVATGQHGRLIRRRLDGSVVGDPVIIRGSLPNLFVVSGVTVLASGHRIVVGDPRAHEIQLLDPAGRLTGLIRTSDPIEAITAATASTMTPAFSPHPGNDPKLVTRYLDRVRTAPRPKVWPAYQRVTITPDGRFWIEEFRRGGAGDHIWTGFDRDGRMLGRLRMPAPIKAGDKWIVAFLSGGVLMRWQDNDGAEHLTTYPLIPIPGTARTSKQ